MQFTATAKITIFPIRRGGAANPIARRALPRAVSWPINLSNAIDDVKERSDASRISDSFTDYLEDAVCAGKGLKFLNLEPLEILNVPQAHRRIRTKFNL